MPLQGAALCDTRSAEHHQRHTTAAILQSSLTMFVFTAISRGLSAFSAGQVLTSSSHARSCVSSSTSKPNTSKQLRSRLGRPALRVALLRAGSVAIMVCATMLHTCGTVSMQTIELQCVAAISHVCKMAHTQHMLSLLVPVA
jgi:hypothetical protein